MTGIAFRLRFANRTLTNVLPAMLVCLLMLIGASRAWAVLPDDPEVKAMVARGYKFLESFNEEDLGRAALVGLAFVKDGKDERHPVVAHAVKVVKQAIQANQLGGNGEHTAYGCSVAGMFLAELNPKTYAAEINTIQKFVVSHQMPHGGWGYFDRPTGDTSQVQYAVLFLWTLQHAGFDVPNDSAEKVLGYLLRTQDPTGGYGYQGVEASAANRVQQNGVSPSLSSAGVSSLFVLADVFGIRTGSSGAKAGKKNSELPPALTLVTPEKGGPDGKRAKATRVPTTVVRQALADGAKFCDAQPLDQKTNWHNYFMYAYERFQSFRELAEGQTELVETQWYNRGVDYLKKNQNPDGSWSDNAGQACDTAFSVLFLTRSTKKAIAKAIEGEGLLAGGKGIFGNVAKAKLRDGKVVGAVEKGPADEMISVLEDPSNLDVESLAQSPEVIELSRDPKKFAAQVERLRRLVGAEDHNVRMVAVKTLGRTGDFDNVPMLIYALTDPDKKIARAANDGLRNVSRKFDAVLPEAPSATDFANAVARWKQWYKSVNPAAVFIEPEK